jgi:hypothetical protein
VWIVVRQMAPSPAGTYYISIAHVAACVMTLGYVLGLISSLWGFVTIMMLNGRRSGRWFGVTLLLLPLWALAAACFMHLV